MSFDIESLNLDETPLEGLEEAAEKWVESPEFPPAIKPGKHSGIITSIRDMTGDNGILKVTLDLECRDSESYGEKINFQRFSSKLFQRRDGTVTSQLLDLIKSSGIEQKPRSLKDLAEILNFLMTDEKFVNFQSDLRTYCSACGNNKLMEITGEATAEDAKVALQNMEQSEKNKAYNDVRKAAEKHKNARAIPINQATGRHLDSVECPDCGADLRVNAAIVRWLKPGAVKGMDVAF